MNVSELARQLKTNPNELYELLPQFGFDIGPHAVKVDDRVAYKIISLWPRKIREWKDKQKTIKAEKATKEAIAAAIASGKGTVQVPSAITVRDFAAKLNLPVTTIIRELVKNGILASLNERIDYDTANIIASDFGFKVEPEETKKMAEAKEAASVDRLQNILESEDKSKLVARPPVVVVMGHVDHGKTKLLDAIRKTRVVEGESGGITQHIGAYQVVVYPKDSEGNVSKTARALTFIDTPGHEAFTVMRSRGAKVADMAILVVAVDDGVQPQTKEAIKIIEAAKLPFIVALNKIDKPEADIDKVKTQLAELGLQPDDWGGKTIMVPVAAKAGTNIDKLLDVLILVADMEKENIVSNPDRRAIGTIVEAHVDPQAGPVATLLVQSGTLHPNESLSIEGALYGRVRAMMNWKGEHVREAAPSMPVQILGFKVAPAVGDVLEVPESTKGLERKLKPSYLAQEKGIITAASQKTTAGGEEVAKQKYHIIIKVDVLGSLEAILGSLERMVHPEVGVDVVAKGLGSITESEITQAEATGAHVLGFHVPILPAAERLAKEKGVVIKQYKIIYDLLGDVKKELEKLLVPEVLVEEMGTMDIMGIFRTEKNYLIVGGRVSSGKIENSLKFRIKRKGEEIGKGVISELKVGKEVVKDVLYGQEAGLKVQTKDKIEIGDRLEIYREEIKQKKLGF
ncbi:MAG: translation initiation factor IF-2 [Patescibacteria group bacterium]